MSTTSPIGTAGSLPSLTVGDDGKVHVGGLVNNLDPNSIVNALMGAAAVPQQQLQAKLAAEKGVIGAYQTLNTFLQTLGQAARADSAVDGLNMLTVTSTDKSVTATASTSGAATTVNFQVDKVAQGQVSITGSLASWADTSGNVTIVDSKGVATTVTAKSDSIKDVAAAINAAGKGVTASIVANGKDGSGNPLYRLQLSSTSTGAAAAFQVYAGTSAQVTAGTATNVSAQTLSTAQDAQVTLYPGTGAAQTVTSAGNTFKDLVQGIDVTVSAVTTAPVTLTSSTDAKSISAAASNIIGAITQIVQFIDTNSKEQTKTNSDGSTTTTPASFSGDATIASFRSQIIKAVSAPVGSGAGVSPASFGVNLNADGTVDFDATKFAAAIAADPNGTIAAVQQITGRVAAVTASASDSQIGFLTTSIQAKQKTADRDQGGIDAWTVRLATQRTRLETQYTNLVTQLGTLQNMQAYLSQQFNAMFNPTN